MGDSFKLMNGTTEIELNYAAGSQEDYKLQYGTRVSTPEPAVLLHQPDMGESLPVRAVDRDREIYLTINADGANWDEVFDNVTQVKRMVDGANSQALRYWTVGDVDRVVLRVQKDGATNYTDLPIKWGFVDDSAAYHTEIQSGITGWKIVIMLVVGPYGEGAEIALRNDLSSSPHFIEDSDGDGIADGWLVIGGGGTPSIDTTYYLVGGSSQKYITDTSTSIYFRNDDVTASIGTDAVAYVWVAVPSGAGDDILVQLRDGSNNLIQSKTFDPAAPSGYDKTATGAGGATWYRYVVSGTNSSANFRLLVFRSTATQATTFYIDAAYLQTGTTTAPNAWCSTSSIENRYDPTSSDEARIDYIDVWGVPGDVPGLFRQFLDPDAFDEILTIGMVSSGKFDISDFSHVNENPTGVPTLLGWTETVVADSSRSGGSYIRIVSPGSPTAGTRVSTTIDGSVGPCRVFARARTNASAAGLKVLGRTESGAPANSGFINFQSTNTWEWLDLGAWATVVPPDDANYESVRIGIWAPAVNDRIDIDSIYILPAQDGKFMLIDLASDESTGATNSLNTYPQEKQVRNDSYGLLSVLGGMWEIPCAVSSRIFYLTNARDGTHTLDDTISAEFTITPRTRHLLGTV